MATFFCFVVQAISVLLPKVESFVDSFGDTDGTRGADQTAEVTANALGAHDAGQAGVRVERDSLMTTVRARDVTASAPDAPLAVNLREYDGLAV